MFLPVQKFADFLTYSIFKIPQGSKLSSAVNFFIFDTIKIFILLFVIVFIITFIRTFFSPEKTRDILSHRKQNIYIAHILAALLGIVTPFCSCSAVPLFIGFVEAGIPLGVTFSYLIAAPMVNEVALGLLYANFGLKIAIIYVFSGEIIAIVSGILIGKLNLERYVEDYVFKIKVANVQYQEEKKTLKKRMSETLEFTVQLIKKVWIFVVVGIGIGAFLHGYIPTGALAKIAGKNNPFAVIFATVLGIPLYSNAAGIIPLVSEFKRLGVSMGTSLSFMMSVTALSLPEMILLRRVLKPRLLAIFAAIVGCGIIITGYLFNLILE
ncbi:permease [Caldicellulosiruptor owensensis OL]|uniref:Permease n=1 Tax=Caldicellulosiruptor owensensis (strain ATCC 700167 / DSM 13100 / OL) TaxID=632518 RepID=E4Q721_CALOW|nr:permease [Caldicellulosiruptor owensensis]ADQ05701.1 permease [Caldicellulosiruptor owensensis OL]